MDKYCGRTDKLNACSRLAVLLSAEVTGGRGTEPAPEHLGERPRTSVAQVERDARHLLPTRQARKRGHQTHLLTPRAEGQAELLLE